MIFDPQREILEIIELVVECPLHGLEGIAYSTNPTTGLDGQGRRYVVKGHGDLRVVWAEAVAHHLAVEFAIPTPPWAVCRSPTQELLFGSEQVDQRHIEMWLKQRNVTNWASLSYIAAFDIWLCNPDRNLFNLVGRPDGDGRGRIEVVAIDFEKAVTLRSDTPLFEVNEPRYGRLFFKNELATIVGALSPPPRRVD